MRILSSGPRSDPRYVPARNTSLQAETLPRWAATTTSTPLVGVLYVMRITLYVKAYTTVTWAHSNTAASNANCFFGLWDSTSLAQLATSGDVSSSVNVAAGSHTVTLNYTPTSVADYYLGLLIGTVSTAPIMLAGTVGYAVGNAISPASTSRHNTTGLSALPDPLVLQSSPSAHLNFWLRYE